MLGIALALASSIAWGTSDFLGGLRSRRMSALTVLLVSQPVGLVLALIVAFAAGGDALSARDAAIAAGAGLDLSSGPRPAWTTARTGGVATLLVAAAFARPSMGIEPALVPSLIAIGFFDVLANWLFAVATNHGLLSLVAVAGSLYSAVTVLLARFVLRERLVLPQRVGVVVALAGVALIAAGS